MEEMKEEVAHPKEEPKAKEYKVTANFLNLMFALATLAIVALVRIISRFGVYNMVLHGIVTIVAYALPVLGATFSYLQAKKPTFEFYANVFAFAMVVLGL